MAPPPEPKIINTMAPPPEPKTHTSFAETLASQLLAQERTHHTILFQTGEKIAYAKLQNWMLERLNEGQTLNVIDILSYLQVEINAATYKEPSEGQGPSLSGYAAAAPEANENQNTYIDMDTYFNGAAAPPFMSAPEPDQNQNAYKYLYRSG